MKAIILVVAFAMLMNDAQSRGLSNYEFVRHLLESEDSWDQTPLASNSVGNEACCEPNTLQGTMHLYRTSPDSAKEIKFYHDRRNCRLSTISSSLSSKSSQLRTVVSCSSDAKCTVYAIDEHSAQCKRQVVLNATLDDFWNRCLPGNSNNTGKLRLGADIVGQSSLPLDLWQFSIDLEIHRKLTTALGCLPVAEIVSTSSGSKSGRLAIYFFDLDTRIRDVSVFAIPSYCRLTDDRETLFHTVEAAFQIPFQIKRRRRNNNG